MGKPKAKIEGQISLILMKAGVTAPEIDQCIHWAFGPNAWYIPIRAESIIEEDWIDRWNKLHGNLVKVKASDKFVEFIFVVGTAFVQEKTKNQVGRG